MREQQHSGATATAFWPPDDTEESVVGSCLHQDNIANLRLGLNELATALTLPGGQRPWYAHCQTAISGWRRRDGTPYTTLPDVYLYRHAVERLRATFSLASDGPPLFIIEMLSPTTWRTDLNEERGKPYCYAAGGVQEYLVLDPLGEHLPEYGRGWRLEGDHFVPWLPEAPGRWRSAQFPLAIGTEGIEVAVYGPDGRRQWREGEYTEQLVRQQEELSHRQAELERQAAEIAELRRRLGEQDKD